MGRRYTFLYRLSDKKVLAYCEADEALSAEQIFEDEMGHSSDGWFDVVRFPMTQTIHQDPGTEFAKDYRVTDTLDGVERLPYLKVTSVPEAPFNLPPDQDVPRTVTIQKVDKDGVAMVEPSDDDSFVLEVSDGSVNRDAPGKACRECALVNGVYTFNLYPELMSTHSIEVTAALEEQTVVSASLYWELPDE